MRIELDDGMDQILLESRKMTLERPFLELLEEALTAIGYNVEIINNETNRTE